jgi:hypothetical protein
MASIHSSRLEVTNFDPSAAVSDDGSDTAASITSGRSTVTPRSASILAFPVSTARQRIAPYFIRRRLRPPPFVLRPKSPCLIKDNEPEPKPDLSSHLECGICSSTLTSPVTLAGCSHTYDLPCIIKWIYHDASCPDCRHAVTAFIEVQGGTPVRVTPFIFNYKLADMANEQFAYNMRVLELEGKHDEAREEREARLARQEQDVAYKAAVTKQLALYNNRKQEAAREIKRQRRAEAEARRRAANAHLGGLFTRSTAPSPTPSLAGTAVPDIFATPAPSLPRNTISIREDRIEIIASAPWTDASLLVDGDLIPRGADGNRDELAWLCLFLHAHFMEQRQLHGRESIYV